MSDNICTLCGRNFRDMPEEGCEECGLDYDPLQPDVDEELDFESDKSDRYEKTPDVFDEATLWED